ncbi:hypothetical protein G3465_15145 [Shewanella baltica]|uniref:hypothetical protein n=1 Tax=Shewanella baltica TaxID=62322 RepID=UPI00217EE03E|nr:hypothetical protein [Shewanella baltica]MCS6100708.1 hypothetical protein [Shewanella baltica]MCS6102346.1 hypothetical protein [Shewanella baltica]MCS6154228.1 hypothetical protein [Shewanella baltica]MCS6184682.1 hypothetical protein [Shewanella baltica]MCS6185520.1 hypothetical protein [Shewanella baltica]
MDEEKKKQLEVLKGSGIGGFGVILLGMLWNIQTTIADGNAGLNRVINEIDKRVVALEVKQQREDIYNVQRLTK